LRDIASLGLLLGLFIAQLAHEFPHVFVIVVAWYRDSISLLRGVILLIICIKRLLLSLLRLEIIEVLVDGEFEHVVKHARDQNLENLGTFFDARVGIDFNEPRVEVLVQYEVVAE
jgi:hypothetical protein